MVAATRGLPSKDTTPQPTPTPRLDVEDNDEGYIYERPNHTRRRVGSNDEDGESDERPTKRVHLQSPEGEDASRQANRLHSKHSCGRRTQGATRRR